MNYDPAHRPSQRDPEIHNEAIGELAKACAKWASDTPEEWVPHLSRLPLHQNGYELARALENRTYISPDLELVELLDSASSYLWSAERDAVKAWVVACGIKAPLAIGTRVTCSRGTGEIRSIREDEAAYTVLPDAERDKPEYRHGGGWIIKYEDASAIEAQRAATVKQGAVHESAVGEAETPK